TDWRLRSGLLWRSCPLLQGVERHRQRAKCRMKPRGLPDSPVWGLPSLAKGARMKTHLGHYEIVAELGRGGMGVVYKGYEPSLTRYVAIKELSPALAHDAMLVERFLREARSMAALNDPHIIQIYFIGQENDQPFFVMEFVEGESLSGLIK